MRKPIVAGNWKMNKTASEAEALINELKPLVADVDCEVVVCPAFVCLDRAAKALAGSNIRLGAQDVYWEAGGAYTSQVSITMLKDVGVEYVILGHSERRQYFGETDETVNKKTKVVLDAGLIPIVCVGETLEQREAGETTKVVAKQVKGALAGLSAGQVADLVIAYEPVWAIGTGKVATTEQAQEVHAAIRNLLGDLYDTGTAEQVRIQYGGSMKPDNAVELLSQTDIDGGLIGGAALKAADFTAICKAAKE